MISSVKKTLVGLPRLVACFLLLSFLLSVSCVYAPMLLGTLRLAPSGDAPTVLGMLLGPFVELGGAPSGLLFLGVLMGLIYRHQLIDAWYSDRQHLIYRVSGGLLAIFLFQWIFFRGVGWAWLTSAVLLLWLGPALRNALGENRFNMLSAVILLATQLFGFGLLTLNPTLRTIPVGGFHPLITGWMTALCMIYGAQRLALFGVTARQFIWVLVGLECIEWVSVGGVSPAMSLIAIATVWLSMTRNTGPGQWKERFHLWRLRRRVDQRRKRFKVVDGNGGKGS